MQKQGPSTVALSAAELVRTRAGISRIEYEIREAERLQERASYGENVNPGCAVVAPTQQRRSSLAQRLWRGSKRSLKLEEGAPSLRDLNLTRNRVQLALRNVKNLGKGGGGRLPWWPAARRHLRRCLSSGHAARGA